MLSLLVNQINLIVLNNTNLVLLHGGSTVYAGLSSVRHLLVEPTSSNSVAWKSTYSALMLVDKTPDEFAKSLTLLIPFLLLSKNLLHVIGLLIKSFDDQLLDLCSIFFWDISVTLCHLLFFCVLQTLDDAITHTEEGFFCSCNGASSFTFWEKIREKIIKFIHRDYVLVLLANLLQSFLELW